MSIYEKNVNFNQGLVIGSLAGTAGFCSTLPLDFVKQYIQSGHNYKDIVGVVSKGGYKKLFRGVGIGSAVVAPQMAIKFGVCGALGGSVSAGFVAGFVDGGVLGIPLAVQAVQQMNTHVGVIGGFKKVLGNGFTRYMGPLAMRNACYTTFMLGSVYPVRKVIFDNDNERDIGLSKYLFQIFMTSSLLNIGGCLVSSPWDVIRAHQIDNLVGREMTVVDGVRRTKMKEVIHDIINKEGYKGFYRGFGNYLVTFGMRFPLTVVIGEFLKNVMF